MESFFFDLPLPVNGLLIVFSLYIVIRASHWLVDGAIQIAHEFNISPLVIGATAVAMGTSAAEIAINMAIVLGGGDTSAVVGNILGSNLVNFGIGLGIPALIAGVIIVPRDALERDVPLYLAATGLLTAFVHDGNINRLEAIVMLAVFIAAIGLIIQYARDRQAGNVLLVDMSQVEAITHPTAHQLSMRQAVFALFGGLTVLVFASRLLIFNTTVLADALSIPEFVIGLVIIGPGTSLPEIASAIQAVRRDHADLVIGMAFGSNLFNLLFGLGLPALITPLAIDETAILSFTFMDIINLSLLALLLLDLGWLAKARAINRAAGVYLIITYVSFVALEVVRAAGGTDEDWLRISGPVVLVVGLVFAGRYWVRRVAASRSRVGAAPQAKILCATRGGKESQSTHQHAIALAREQNAELLFLYVFDQTALYRVSTPIVINVEAQTKHMLDFLQHTAQEQARESGVNARVIVRTGSLRDQIKIVAHEEHVDLIVLGSPSGTSSQFQRDGLNRFSDELEKTTGVLVARLE
ncbi:MAG: calcium/sodium antiporter [Anaerolineae bacterium]|nr:calcium/sodium antiporter [Anaerolineae bacterium]